jgi:SAM-dependent methyltransferase
MMNWENYALTHNDTEAINIFSIYSQQQCCKLITGNKLLKTDLFNEGIATTRDILSNTTKEVFGIDVSKTVCLKAHSNNRHISVVQASIQKLPFKAEVFDCILDLSTIDHVSQKGAVEALREYYNVLSKKGVLSVYYAQDTFLGKLFWRGGEGVILQNPDAMLRSLFGTLLVDRGFDLLSTLSLIPPFHWARRLIRNLPSMIQKNIIFVASFVDCSKFPIYYRTKYAFRLHTTQKVI